jgi:hypothetical protein
MFRPTTTIAFKAFCLDQLEAASEPLEEEDPVWRSIALERALSYEFLRLEL